MGKEGCPKRRSGKGREPRNSVFAEGHIASQMMGSKSYSEKWKVIGWDRKGWKGGEGTEEGLLSDSAVVLEAPD
jgi:hypothetical protein